MVTTEMMSEMAQGKGPSFIFTCAGKVQMWRAPHGTGLILATSFEAAKVVRDHLRKQTSKNISICEVGTLQGETLASQIALAVVDQGATGVYVSEGGEENYYFAARPCP